MLRLCYRLRYICVTILYSLVYCIHGGLCGENHCCRVFFALRYAILQGIQLYMESVIALETLRIYLPSVRLYPAAGSRIQLTLVALPLYCYSAAAREIRGAWMIE